MSLSWLSELTDEDATEVRAVLDAATGADRHPPVSEAGRLRLTGGGGAGGSAGGGTGGGAVHLLARTPDRLAGYAQVDADGTAELAVHPEVRRRGVGDRLMAELVRRHPVLRAWAHGEHPGAVVLAERYGFRRQRVLLRLRRPLDATGPDLAEPVLPDGVRLRAFEVGRDEAEFVQVNNRAFAWHPEQGGWRPRDVELRAAEPWFDPDGFLLAVDEEDRILGYHWTKVHTTQPGLGEVYVLGVDPAAHGRGLGAALTLAGLRYLRGLGLDTVMLYVESDNEAALRTYRKLGFEHWDTDVQFAR